MYAMSADYRYLVGKISMDMDFASKFFAAKDAIMAKFNLTSDEKENLKKLRNDKFQVYRDSVALRSGDCNVCCNDPTSDCFSACCA